MRLRSCVVLSAAATFAVIALTPGTALAPPGPPDQITICHRPPGNPENPQTITISINALQAHLAHGDTIGPCDGYNYYPPSQPKKITICHIPPGNRDRARPRTITISINALAAHLAHGDTIGSCGGYSAAASTDGGYLLGPQNRGLALASLILLVGVAVWSSLAPRAP